MNESRLSLIAVTLCFTVGITLIELVVSQVTAAAITADLLLRSIAVGALCGLIADFLRFVSSRIGLESHPGLKCRRQGKDMRRLLEQTLGPTSVA